MSIWAQVSLSKWEETPRDRSAVALFRPTVNEPPFAGLVFEYPVDEDGYGFAIVLLPSGSLIAFVDDPGNTIRGTLLWRTGDSDPLLLITEVCEIGGILESDLIWTVGQPLKYE